MVDDAKVTTSSDNREKIQTIVLRNILQADTGLKIWQSLRDPESIKFLRVYKALGYTLPQAFSKFAILSLARLYDQSRHPAVVSLSRLVRLAADAGLNETQVGELDKKITDHDAELGVIRDKYLAHSDIDAPEVTLTFERIGAILKDAKEIHECAVGVLFPKERWATEFIETEKDAKAFIDYLKAWDYPGHGAHYVPAAGKK